MSMLHAAVIEVLKELSIMDPDVQRVPDVMKPASAATIKTTPAVAMKWITLRL